MSVQLAVYGMARIAKSCKGESQATGEPVVSLSVH